MEEARKGAAALMSLLEQQPSPGRFYYWLTPDGRLVTEESPLDGKAPFIDAAKVQQPYYFSGIPQLALARMHMATGESGYLEASRGYFEFSLGFAEDAYAYPPAGNPNP